MIVSLTLLMASPRDALAGGMEGWLATRGPLLEGSAQARAEAALRSVHPCAESSSLRIHVLDTRDVGAFAWPEGDIIVTSALLDLLDDDELAAALAHEIGHLLSDDHLHATATLIGRPSSHEKEAAADELGVRVLVAGGRRAEAMAHMLERVQAALGPENRGYESMAHRLQLLRQSL